MKRLPRGPFSVLTPNHCHFSLPEQAARLPARLLETPTRANLQLTSRCAPVSTAMDPISIHSLGYGYRHINHMHIAPSLTSLHLPDTARLSLLHPSCAAPGFSPTSYPLAQLAPSFLIVSCLQVMGAGRRVRG